MATTAGRDVFVDANILVYATASAMPLHATATGKLNSFSAAGDRLYLSRQVVREFVATSTRKGVVLPPLTPTQAVAACRSIENRFRMLEEDHNVTNQLYTSVQQFQVVGPKVHDTNIVATMLAHGVAHIQTHNTADFSRYAGLTSILPLV